jgi:glycine/D-amino acid oxidase-like deaminating enzyme
VTLRIAILGGGGVGTCAALEIARHGHHVDVFEQDAQPVWRASRVNEGKIHQGFLYAKDTSLRTARMMARGALTFTACLSRWIDVGPDSLNFSTPFMYAVHRDTQVDVARLRVHFAACCSIFAEMQAASGLRYLGRDEPAHFSPLDRREIEQAFDPQVITAAFITSEYSIDPRVIAHRLGAALLAEPRVSFIGGARVVDVARRNGGYQVAYDDGSAQMAGPYDHVVNALWEGRLAIDQRLGLAPEQSWIHRHKFGNRVGVALGRSDLPSVTIVLGPFGDVVNFGANGFFLSWYPSGMVASSHALEPPRDWNELSAPTRHEIFERSLERWLGICPKLNDVTFDRAAVDPASGAIFAWGDSDIGDPASKLHDRYEIGIHSVDRYHSINTGKYTMVPYLGLKTAERVLSLEPDHLGLPAS